MFKLHPVIKTAIIAVIVLVVYALGTVFMEDMSDGLLVSGILILVFSVLYFSFFRSMLRNHRILKKGSPAEGKIIKVWYTGVMVNKRSQLGLLLEVRSLTRAPFLAEATALGRKRKDPGEYKTGNVFQVRYDPDNLKYAAIVSPKPIRSIYEMDTEN